MVSFVICIYMPKHKVNTGRHLTFEELTAAWWSIHDGFEHIENEEAKSYMIRKSFEQLLEQCGWQVSEWNEENQRHKKKKK